MYAIEWLSAASMQTSYQAREAIMREGDALIAQLLPALCERRWADYMRLLNEIELNNATHRAAMEQGK